MDDDACVDVVLVPVTGCTASASSFDTLKRNENQE